MTLSYRLRQGMRALFAFSQQVDYTLAASALTPPQLALFRQMSRGEQLHSLNVLRTILEQESHTPDDLAAAALLHDVGKSRYRLSIAQKSLAIIVHKALPGLYRSLSRGDTLNLWRAPFIVRQQHPRWGAEMLRQTHTAERVLWLVEHHQDAAAKWQNHPHYELLRRLQRADNMN